MTSGLRIQEGNPEASQYNLWRTVRFSCAFGKTASQAGVDPGDRVAAYMPNLMETAVAMLAATSIGAIWSSCGTELGPGAVVDRLGQIEPKVLFTVGGYPYKGQVFDVLPRLEKIAEGVPSLEKIVVLPYVVEKPEYQPYS